MRVLVTGASGFIGLNLVHSLADSHDAVALVRESSPVRFLPEGVEIVEGNIRDPESLDEPLEGVDAVVHLGAVYSGFIGSIGDRPDPEWDHVYEVNVAGTKTLLEKAQEHGVERFVFMSTILAHPDLRHLDDSDYVRSKVLAERAFAEDLPIDWTILYPTYVVGPRDYRLNRYHLFKKVAMNLLIAPPIYTPGGFNIVHVDDVVRSIELALKGGTEDRQILSGKNHTTETVYGTICSICSGRHYVVPVPDPVALRLLPWLTRRLYERGYLPLPGEELAERTMLGVVPREYQNRCPVRPRSLRTTLEDAHDWYRSVGLL